MRKFALLLLLMPTFIMVVSGAANAQRRNTTSHDVVKIEKSVEEKNDVKSIDNMKKDCKCDCKHHKKHKKKHKKKHHDN